MKELVLYKRSAERESGCPSDWSVDGDAEVVNADAVVDDDTGADNGADGDGDALMLMLMR